MQTCDRKHRPVVYDDRQGVCPACELADHVTSYMEITDRWSNNYDELYKICNDRLDSLETYFQERVSVLRQQIENLEQKIKGGQL